MQRALLQYTNPKNRALVREALEQAGRKDLIRVLIPTKRNQKLFETEFFIQFKKFVVKFLIGSEGRFSHIG